METDAIDEIPRVGTESGHDITIKVDPGSVITYAQPMQSHMGQPTVVVAGDSVRVQTMPGVMHSSSPGGQAQQTQYIVTGDQGMVLNASMASSPPQIGEESSRKREMRLIKNREAARECRRKKKEYVKCLENRVAVLESQNKTLIEELKTMKDLYCNKGS